MLLFSALHVWRHISKRQISCVDIQEHGVPPSMKAIASNAFRLNCPGELESSANSGFALLILSCQSSCGQCHEGSKSTTNCLGACLKVGPKV